MVFHSFAMQRRETGEALLEAMVQRVRDAGPRGGLFRIRWMLFVARPVIFWMRATLRPELANWSTLIRTRCPKLQANCTTPAIV
jgi:hypothetical protein